MLLTKKNTSKRANVKRGKDTPVIVTKSTTTGASPLCKKN